MSTDTSQLSRLTTPEEYQSTRTHVFPSQASLAWFIRRHRQRIIDAGAMSIPAGRKLIDNERFDQVVVDVGQAALKKAA